MSWTPGDYNYDGKSDYVDYKIFTNEIDNSQNQNYRTGNYTSSEPAMKFSSFLKAAAIFLLSMVLIGKSHMDVTLGTFLGMVIMVGTIWYYIKKDNKKGRKK